MKNLSFLIIAIVLLAALFFVFKPGDQASDNQTQSFSIEVRNHSLVSGPEVMKVREGDHVVINIVADEEEEFHLHGYDRSVDLKPDTAAQLSFTADISGRFVFELEKSKTELGALEVQPK